MSDEILYEWSGKKGFDIFTVANPLTPVDTPLYMYEKTKYGEHWELVDSKRSKAYMKALLKPFIEASEGEERWLAARHRSRYQKVNEK